MEEGPECGRCGGDLPAAIGVRTVECGYCGEVQDNPRPFESGQEVLIPGPMRGLQLVRVARANGPDRITLANGAAHALEALIPVAMAPPEPGQQVFFQAVHGWKTSWVRSVDGHDVRVVHPSRGFRSPFFDRQVDPQQLRVHLDPAKRRQRSSGEAILARLRDDPVDAIFMLMRWIFVSAFLLFVLYVVGSLVIGALR